MNTRHQDTITGALAPYHVPHAVMQAILGSVGGIGQDGVLVQTIRADGRG